MGAVNHVQGVLERLANMRSDEAFKEIISEKEKFISRTGETFAPLPVPRRRRVRRLPGERAEDEPIDDELQKIKVFTYFASLDAIHTLIADRFSDNAQGIFEDLSLFTKERILEIQKNISDLPDDAFSKFCNVYGNFLTETKLKTEYLQFAECFSAYKQHLALFLNSFITMLMMAGKMLMMMMPTMTRQWK